MEKGESMLLKFHIITVSSDPLLVYLTSSDGNLDFFSREAYKDVVSNFSEEAVTSWIEFFKNPVELKPTGQTLQGGVIKAWEEISLLLSVPENAEPGYHTISVKPTPYVYESTTGDVGAMIVAVTSVNFIFNVKGDARREGVIIDVVNGGYRSDGNKLKTYFRNTGTVTITARSHNTVYNKTGEFLAEGFSGIETVKPGQTLIFETPIKATLPAGEYYVFADVDYNTGKASMNSTLSLEHLPLTPAVVAVPAQGLLFSPWLLVILIIALSIVIYRWKK